MRGLRRSFRIVVFTVALTTAAILLTVLEDKCDTYDPVSYIMDSLPWLGTDPLDDINLTKNQGIIVVPTMHPDDVSWIADELPE